MSPTDILCRGVDQLELSRDKSLGSYLKIVMPWLRRHLLVNNEGDEKMVTRLCEESEWRLRRDLSIRWLEKVSAEMNSL